MALMTGVDINHFYDLMSRIDQFESASQQCFFYPTTGQLYIHPKWRRITFLQPLVDKLWYPRAIRITLEHIAHAYVCTRINDLTRRNIILVYRQLRVDLKLEAISVLFHRICPHPAPSLFGRLVHCARIQKRLPSMPLEEASKLRQEQITLLRDCGISNEELLSLESAPPILHLVESIEIIFQAFRLNISEVINEREQRSLASYIIKISSIMTPKETYRFQKNSSTPCSGYITLSEEAQEIHVQLIHPTRDTSPPSLVGQGAHSKCKKAYSFLFHFGSTHFLYFPSVLNRSREHCAEPLQGIKWYRCIRRLAPDILNLAPSPRLKAHVTRPRERVELEQTWQHSDLAKIIKHWYVPLKINPASEKDYAPVMLVDIINIMIDISTTLTYLHAHNIAHRDIRPGNILVHAADGQFKGLLSDPNLAHMFGVSNQKPNYEYWDYKTRQGEVSHSCDIYGLTMTLLETFFKKDCPLFYQLLRNTNLITNSEFRTALIKTMIQQCANRVLRMVIIPENIDSYYSASNEKIIEIIENPSLSHTQRRFFSEILSLKQLFSLVENIILENLLYKKNRSGKIIPAKTFLATCQTIKSSLVRNSCFLP
jgi:hypothetical protein